MTNHTDGLDAAGVARTALHEAKTLLSDLALGKSIHNDRFPDNKIEGPLWSRIGDVVKRCEAAIEATRRSALVDVPAGERDGPWCQPMDCGKHTPRKFLLRFDDADRGDCVFDDEAEAREFFERANGNWNCYLFGALPLFASPRPAVSEAMIPQLGGAPDDLHNLIKVVFAEMTIEQMGEVCREVIARRMALAASPKPSDPSSPEGGR